MRVVVVVLVLAAAAAAPGALFAQGQEQAEIDEGGKLFEKSCRICHGEAGVGNRAPALRGARLTIDYLTRIIAAGKPGTMMPRFENAFSARQIHQLALYIRSVQQPDSPWAALRGTSAPGERVFFDQTQAHSCHNCHAFQGRGRRVGPDLHTKLKGRSARDIFQKIVIVPHRSADPAYISVALTMRDGSKLVGIKAEETDTELRFYDTSVLPPKVVTLAKPDIVSTRRLNSTAMPSDYASRLPLQQLLDLVAYLKSTVDGTPTVVGFDDVIDIRTPTRQ